MPSANHDRGDADSGAAAVPDKNGVAHNAAHNKVVVAVPDRNGDVHNNGDAAGKGDNDGHNDGGHHW